MVSRCFKVYVLLGFQVFQGRCVVSSRCFQVERWLADDGVSRWKLLNIWTWMRSTSPTMLW